MSSSAGSSKPAGKPPVAPVTNPKTPPKGSNTDTPMVDTPTATPPDELGDLKHDSNADDTKRLRRKLNKVQQLNDKNANLFGTSIKALQDQLNKAEAHKQHEIQVLHDYFKQVLTKQQEREDHNAKIYQAQLNKARENIHTTHRGKEIGEILKPKAPKPYDGNPEDLQPFIMRLKMYFKTYPTLFSSEMQKVEVALSRLKGKPLQ